MIIEHEGECLNYGIPAAAAAYITSPYHDIAVKSFGQMDGRPHWMTWLASERPWKSLSASQVCG